MMPNKISPAAENWRSHVATLGKPALAVAFIAGASVLVHNWYPGVLWNFFFPTQSGGLGNTLITGIVSSLAATLIYSIRHREVWHDDISKIKKDLETLLTLREAHELLLKGVGPAIGGPFTRSLFEFHPMASEQIAHILSDQTDILYRRHHKRVIVKTATDSYTVKGLERVNGAVVWSLDFRIEWQWLNDSKITKYPLDDFLLVADANDEALDSFFPDAISNAQRRTMRESRRDFFLERNLVRSVLVNPSDLTMRLPDDVRDKVFQIDQVFVTRPGHDTRPVNKAQLLPVDPSKLPIGVYAAWSLPQLDPELNPPLARDARLTVEYRGRVCLVANETEDGAYDGYMTYRPSDVIGDKYELKLTCPRDARFEDRPIAFEILHRKSGYQHIYGTLVNPPRPSSDLGGIHLTLDVDGPLTELDQISLAWKGGVSNEASPGKRRADDHEAVR